MRRYADSTRAWYHRFGLGKDWFRAVAHIMANSWFAIVSAALIGAVLGLTLSLLQQPTYQSTAVLYESPIQGDSDGVAKQRVQGIVGLLKSDRLVSAALRKYSLQMSVSEAQKATSIDANVGASVINIVTTTHDAKTSAKLANALANTLPRLVQELDGAAPWNPPPSGSDPATMPDGNMYGPALSPVDLPPPLPDAGPPAIPVRLSIITPAVPAERAAAPKFGRNVALGLIAGTLLAIFASYLTARLAPKVQDNFELSYLLGAPVLASVPENRNAQGPCIVDFSQPGSRAADAFRRMRTSIGGSELLTGPQRRIVVTSPSGRDGKTTVAVNLALALSVNGFSVVLVDAALRMASTEPSDGPDLPGDSGRGGLAGYIRGDGDIAAYVQPTRYPGLDVIYAGEDVVNPTELLGTERLRAGLDELAARYDYVVVDSVSLRSSSDAIVLARAADVVLLVVRSNKTRYIDLGSSLELLDGSGIPLVGVVLNGYPNNGLLPPFAVGSWLPNHGLRPPFGRAPQPISIRQTLEAGNQPVASQAGDGKQGDELVPALGGDEPV